MEVMKYQSASEKAIITRLVTDALAAEYLISVWDGEEYAVTKSGDKKAILESIGATEMDHLIFYDVSDKRIGHVTLIYGNEPGVVMADYSMSLEEFLIPINAYAATFE